MKKVKFIQILTIAIVSVLFFSCVKQDFKDPLQIVPNAQLTANTTIAELLLRHPFPSHKNKIDSIKGDTIIQGVVTGNDESGNIYKQMVIQDGTAGIVINVDMADYYNEYKIGQKIFIKCKGLVIGDYSGLSQLGLPYLDPPWSDWKVGRIPSVYIKKYIFKDGLPNDTLKPKKINDLSILTNLPSLVLSPYVNTLVTLDSVSFSDIGKAYTEKYFTTDRRIVDQHGKIILVRTSNYSNFATDLLPDGVGKLTGILSYYASGSNSVYQLIIRNKKEIGPFLPSINIMESFTSSLGSFNQYSVIGNEQIWVQSTVGGTYAKMTGYVSSSLTVPNEDWLISKKFDFSQFITIIFSFQSQMRYGSANDNSLKVYSSTNYSGSGNPTTADWTEIPGVVLSPSLSSWGSWTSSGDINLSNIRNQNVHIAFKYSCSSTNAPTWEITNIKIKGSSPK